MTLYEFSLLNEIEQMQAFWHGVQIGEQRDRGYVIECRQIDDFYVEYHILDGNPVHMRSFKNPDFLAPYLDNINIDSILFS